MVSGKEAVTEAATMTEIRKRLGARGEDAAVDHLDRIGIEIIERNWRCALGEIDIVARDGNVLVFVEVKTRKQLSAGSPEEAVNSAKQQRYSKLARAYLQDHEYTDAETRFDVIAITVTAKNRARLRHVQNAYACSAELN